VIGKIEASEVENMKNVLEVEEVRRVEAIERYLLRALTIKSVNFLTVRQQLKVNRKFN
jgi:hypothetical protein